MALLTAAVLAAPLPDAAKPREAQSSSAIPARPPLPPEVLVRPAGGPPSSAQAAAGPRVFVRRLVIEGAVDRPASAIRVADVQALAMRLLHDRLATRARPVNPTGAPSRTPLTTPLQTPAETITPEAMDALIQRLQDSQAQAGLSIAELQGIAAEVARYYRQHGLILAQAVIPPQTVRDDGVVRIRVVEGILGQVLVEKNRRFRSAQLTQPFADLVGRPVRRESMEEALLLLADYPGLRSFGVFQPGNEPGSSDLVISVVEEDPVRARVHVDNFGSQYTGEYRLRLDVDLNNPLRRQDRIFFNATQTFSPHKGVYGGVGYEAIAFGPRNRIGLSHTTNVYDLGGSLEPFGIAGTTRISELYWRRLFLRQRLLSLQGSLSLARKSVILDVSEGRDTADELTVLALGGELQRRSIDGRSSHAGHLRWSQGFAGILGSMSATTDPDAATANRRGGSGVYPGSDFGKLDAGYDYWRALSATHSLHLAAAGQYSRDLLASIEQFAIGGPNSVRAYANAEYLADSGYSLSLEWLMRAPGFAQWPVFGGPRRWGEVLDLVLFADTGQGWLNDPLASDRENLSLHGAGAGLRLHIGGFSSRFEVAAPIGNEEAGNGRNPQYYFELNAAF